MLIDTTLQSRVFKIIVGASNPEMALLLPIHISRSDGSGGLYDQINHLTVQGKNTVLDLPKCTDANHKGRWIHNSLAKSRHHSNDWVWQPFECAYNMDDRLEFTQMHLYVHKEAKETIQALISPSKCMDPSLADTKFCNKIQNNQNHVYIDDRLVYWYSIEGITSRTPKDFNRMAILKRLDLAQRQEFPDEAGFSRGTLLNEPDIVLVGPGPFVDSHRDKSTLDRTIREFAERIYANFPNALVIYKTGVYDPSRNVHEQRLFDLRVSKTFQSEVGAFVWDTWQMEISYPNVDLEYKNRVLFSRH
ncbi:hypothetical protein EDD86DRAFT_94572 [Gorgonomyces haynaldii]|nr:hypothetical protein EDD86DRAFT_94572 [Gorgonomyces haynaldii]